MTRPLRASSLAALVFCLAACGGGRTTNQVDAAVPEVDAASGEVDAASDDVDAASDDVDAASEEVCASPVDTGNPACDSCVDANCCDYTAACVASAACVDLNGCLASCVDETCAQACAADNPEGSAVFEQILSCMQASCSAECS